MTPGIVTQNPQAASQLGNTQGEFSVNGQQPLSNSFFVDGVSANIDSGLSPALRDWWALALLRVPLPLEQHRA